MAMLALRKRIQSFSLVLLLQRITVFADTDISSYVNADCEGRSSNATVHAISQNGNCSSLDSTKSLAATVSDESQRYGCIVNVYSDPDCTDDATSVTMDGRCNTTAFTVESYSVDCYLANGTIDSGTDSESSAPSTEKTLLGTTANPVGSTTSTAPLQPPSSATSSSPQDSAQPTSTSSTSKASISSSIPTKTSNNLVDTASSRAAATTRSSHALSSSPSSTSTNSNSNSNTNLSRNGQIALGVVLPSLAIIVSIIIAIVKCRGQDKSGGDDRGGHGRGGDVHQNYYMGNLGDGATFRS